jgi:ADP-ribosyl-[dinitrogen reductase] hydrolase
MHEILPEGMLHLQMPIADGSIPSAEWENQWIRESSRIHAVLRRGGKICVHCNAGFGRSGIIAARLLVEEGFTPNEAISMVRKARPGTIETPQQEDYVRSLTVEQKS